MSLFDQAPETAIDPLFGLNRAYLADQREEKLNLVLGVYRPENLNPTLLRSVKKAKIALLESETHKEYLPIRGDQRFLDGIESLLFGGISEDRIRLQSLGGTGALRLSSSVLVACGLETVYISDPTWANHKNVFRRTGLNIETYTYWNESKKGLDEMRTFERIKSLKPGSVILFHASCHNPTGCNFSDEMWQHLVSACAEKGHIALFDIAYHGMGRGFEGDSYAIRLWEKYNLPAFVAYSCSKNFGLYGERTGALFMLGLKKHQERLTLLIEGLIRGGYSNPPRHGAGIVRTILESPTLRKEWEEDVNEMKLRMSSMRQALANRLAQDSSSFEFIRDQVGMFCYLDLEDEWVARLRAEKAIYLPKRGRVNVAGLDSQKIEQLAEAIYQVKGS